MKFPSFKLSCFYLSLGAEITLATNSFDNLLVCVP